MGSDCAGFSIGFCCHCCSIIQADLINPQLNPLVLPVALGRSNTDWVIGRDRYSKNTFLSFKGDT